MMCPQVSLVFVNEGVPPWHVVFLQDIVAYFKHQISPLHVTSLDAEKCFDNICHVGLLYKIMDKFHAPYWAFLHSWYHNLDAIVKWKGTYNTPP